MVKDVTVNGKEYRVDTNCESFFGRRIVTICGLASSPASGVLARTIQELTGKAGVVKDEVKLTRAEEIEVVLALGWKFSPSNSWKNEWEYCRNYRQGRTIDQ